MNQPVSGVRLLLTILTILFAFFFPQIGLIPIPFGYAIPVLLLIWITLRTGKETFSDIGFRFKSFELRTLWIGALAAILLFLLLSFVIFPLINSIYPLPRANLTRFNSVRHNTSMYLFYLLMSWVGGGIYEELVFHGFIFTRLEKSFPAKYATPISFILTNLIFGLYHVQQGPSGMLNALFCGLAYQGLMLGFKRNLWYATTFHAFFDCIGFTFIYLGLW